MIDKLFKVTDECSIPDWMSSESNQSLREGIKLNEDIEGFPVAAEDTIIRNSLPAYYVSAPNPFLKEKLLPQIDFESTAEQKRPLAIDIVAGKNDPLYFAHYYSTKVPPRGIIPFILHYTKPGETVFDGFCGTGMTGVAAQLCADPNLSNTYGLKGKRKAVLSDLSPSATFIAAGTNAIGELVQCLDYIESIVDKIEFKHKKLLHTSHVGWPRDAGSEGKRINSDCLLPGGPGLIEYIVWSDVFTCSACNHELSYWELVFRGPGKETPKKSPCPHCGSEESINSLQRVWQTRFDYEIEQVVRQAKQVPVLVNYRVGTKRFEKHPDEYDIRVIADLSSRPLPSKPPCYPTPEGFNTAQPAKSHGFTHVHHFYTQRNLLLMNEFWNHFNNHNNSLMRMAGLYTLTGAVQRVCRLNRYMPNHDRHVGPLSGTLYVAPLTAEIPATSYLRARIKDLRKCSKGPDGNGVTISTQSATDLRNIPENTIDYIFTDPPFGGNLNYSELNTIIEMWLSVRTNNHAEAIVNEVQQKGMPEYQSLMKSAFSEFYRVLKPQRWMTVEFHNSQNAVWAAVQEALMQAGFVVADVRTLDKKKGTTKQLSYGAAVKQDLIISCYKPSIQLEEQIKLESGSKSAVWEFIDNHLSNLPIFVNKGGTSEIIIERKDYLLYDRMVAFHVQRGVTVPFSSVEFYREISQRYSEREGMYFLPNQAAEYDKKRMMVGDVEQLAFFVSDEASARMWLRELLRQKPQTFQELHSQYLKEIGAWNKAEKRLELSTILEQNFLCYDGKGMVPVQIHAYLSTNWKDLRNLPKDDPTLMAKARNRWYVPDPNKAGDLERLREKALLKEFEEYKEGKKKLKVFRLEAVRAGFKKAWQERDYTVIIAVASKIPSKVLEEDPKLLMWYDQAVTRMGRD